MTIKLRLLLLLGSVATLAFFLSKIRERKIKINHSIFWVFFGLIMVVFSVVPGVVDWLSAAFGIHSTTNFIYLFVIFLLMIKSFTNTVKLSKLSEQVTALTQSLAIAQLTDMEGSGQANGKREKHDKCI